MYYFSIFISGRQINGECWLVSDSGLEVVAVPICAPECSGVEGGSGCGFGLPVKVVRDVAEGGGITVSRWSRPGAASSDSVYWIAALNDSA